MEEIQVRLRYKSGPIQHMTLDPYSTFEELCYNVDGKLRRSYTKEELPSDDTMLIDILGSREVLEVIEDVHEEEITASESKSKVSNDYHIQSICT